MIWFYGDWSWAYRWTTAAALVVGCVFLTCALVNWVRSRPDARHDQVLVTKGLATRSPSATERERRGMATRQRLAASRLSDSPRRSSLYLAAAVLDPDDDREVAASSR